MVTKTYETVPVHNYVTTVVAPTCTEGGYTLHECACGESYRTDETAALGHNYVKNPSNTVISYTCTRCGDTYTEHTHSYTTATVTEPTCTEDGYTLHECACGYSYRDNVVSKLGHRYIVIAEDGENATYRCTRCGHTYTSPIVTIDPPNPPISSYSLGEDDAEPASSTGCGSERVLKSTVTEEHSYIYASGRLLRETITTTAANGTVTTKVLDFAYDAQGTPYSLTYTNGMASPVTYYYITNLQGDVMYLINGSGTKVATYEYDPYGKITYSTGSMAQINPLRYRGYYYDADTEFYYLQSRYYDATICRFINADSYASTGQGIIGYNMFAYCGNCPVNHSDPAGELFGIVGALVGAAVGAAISTVSCLISSGGEASAKDLLIAAGVGAAAASALTGVYTAATTDGPWYQKLAAGATAATLTFVGAGKAYAWGEWLKQTEGITRGVYAIGTAFINFVSGESADLVSLGTQAALDYVVDTVSPSPSHTKSSSSGNANRNTTGGGYRRGGGCGRNRVATIM